MTVILDAQRGEALKQSGMQAALFASGDWQHEVMAEFRRWLARQKRAGRQWITVEQFRAEARAHPASHQAWGSLARIACVAGLIAPTGQYVKASSPRTRAHPVALWRVL